MKILTDSPSKVVHRYRVFQLALLIFPLFFVYIYWQNDYGMWTKCDPGPGETNWGYQAYVGSMDVTRKRDSTGAVASYVSTPNLYPLYQKKEANYAYFITNSRNEEQLLRYKYGDASVMFRIDQSEFEKLRRYSLIGHSIFLICIFLWTYCIFMLLESAGQRTHHSNANIWRMHIAGGVILLLGLADFGALGEVDALFEKWGYKGLFQKHRWGKDMVPWLALIGASFLVLARFLVAARRDRKDNKDYY